MSSSKKLTCKWTLRQAYIRVCIEYSQSCRCFRHSFVNCCPSPLFSGSTFPPSSPSFLCKYVYCIHVYACSVLGCSSMGIWASDRSTPAANLFPFTDQIFRWRRFALPSMSLIFLRAVPNVYLYQLRRWAWRTTFFILV